MKLLRSKFQVSKHLHLSSLEFVLKSLMFLLKLQKTLKPCFIRPYPITFSNQKQLTCSVRDFKMNNCLGYEFLTVLKDNL